MLTDKLMPWRIAQIVRATFAPLHAALTVQRSFLTALDQNITGEGK